MSLVKDYTAEDLQNALDRGRTIGREEAYAELEQENRLLRARCERLQGELDTAEQANHELKDQLRVEKLSHKDMANVLNNYEELIQKQRTWVGLKPLSIEDKYVRNYLWERALIAVDDPCTRSHPHEDMNEYCQYKTELSRFDAVLDELLAQPQQEPVAIVHRNEYNEYRLEPHDNFDIKSIPFNVDVPLFKTPQRKPLTIEQRNEIARQADENDWHDYDIIDAVEAAHGIKE